jgi:hypothetical protein
MKDNKKNITIEDLIKNLLILVTVAGLTIIQQQLENTGIFPYNPVLKMNQISILLLGIGVIIAIFSYLFYMKIRFGIWCIINPESRKILHDREETLSIKIMVVTLIAQYLTIIPVFIIATYVMTTSNFYRSESHLRVETFFLFVLWLILLVCCGKIFRYFYGNLKK